MIQFTEELKEKMLLFKKTFNDAVPLRQISSGVTNGQLIDAIDKSVESKKNLLPEIFGYSSKSDKIY